MAAPVLVQPIPPQVVNERAAYGPFDLKKYIEAPDGSVVRFSAELAGGQSLPTGLICTEDGILTGIPASDTQGNYEITILAENADGAITIPFFFTIKPSLLMGDSEYIEQLKTQVWQALDQNQPLPELSELYDRPITPLDIYYLLERWGILRIWDAFNLEPPGEKHLLTLEGASIHYNIYDRGSCLVGAPKDLFSEERTIADGLQTARAMAREVYKRGWTIELVGLDKFTRAAWIELQHLGDLYGKRLEVINFSPSPDDVKLYATSVRRGMNEP